MKNPSETLLTLIQDERDLLEGKIDTIKGCFALCESPLEQEFFATWASIFIVNENYDPDGHLSVCNEWQIECGWLTLILFPQQAIEIEGHRYRADFVIETRLQSTTISRSFVIEIDGHDFHERTKTQALKDKSRDRALTRAGYTVLRFTGQEVYRSAINVISEIQNTIRRAVLAAHGSEVKA